MSDRRSPPRNLVELFRDACEADPGALAYAALRDDLGVSQQLSREALDRQARCLAAVLARSVDPGERIILMYPAGLDVVIAFWACILVGAVPVPVPSPDPLRMKNSLPRLHSIAADAGASLIMTTAALAESARGALGSSDLAKARWLETDTVPGGEVPLDDRSVAGDALAYLQYTSGSTRQSRGVMLTHANVFGQLRALGALPSAAKSLCWLPYFHDYGLVHGIIKPLAAGIPSYLMSPLTFLRRPLRWLEAVAQFGISHTGAPDFAYAACVRALAGRSDWSADLSSLTLATCGAERIRPETVAGFTAAFRPHGFRAEAFTPGYGLAEAVLTVTLKPPGESPSVGQWDRAALAAGEARFAADDAPGLGLVGCGAPLPGVEVAIADPESGIVQPDRRVGEIRVRGATVGTGYWNQPELSEAVFGMPLAGESDAWLRTGDLGFLHDDQVYVTGRLKELIIVRGLNHYPQDLEWTCEHAHPAIRPGGVAAFSNDAGGAGEQAVVVCELGRPQDDAASEAIIDRIRRCIVDQHELELADVLLVRRGTLSRTSSGKLRRAEIRRAYETGSLPALRSSPRDIGRLAVDAPRDTTEGLVADIVAAVLNVNQPGIHADFFALGGNSLLATQVISRINDVCGVELPLRIIFDAPTVAALAAAVADRLDTQVDAPALAPITVRDDAVPAPLSYSQRRMLFMQQLAPEGTAWNMPLALRLRGAIDEPALVRALSEIAERHASLRTVFSMHNGEPVQEALANLPVPLERAKVNQNGDRLAAARALLADVARRPFDLRHGPLMRLLLLELAPDDHVFMICKHHIVGDQWSFAVIARELAVLYNAARAGQQAALPPLPLDYADYALWQHQHFTRERLAPQLDYWRAQLADLEPLALPLDRQRPPRQAYDGASVVLQLPDALKRKLQAIGGAHGATLFMTLLAAFKALLLRYSGQDDLAVGVPVANRQHLATESLVGTFVNTVVMRTSLSDDPSFGELLARVRETALAAYSRQDLPFEMLVDELRVPRDPSITPLFQVMFNVVNVPLGEIQLEGLEWQTFEFDRGSAQFDLTVTVDVLVADEVTLEYSTALFDRETIERMGRHYLRLMEGAVADPALPLSRLPLLDDQEQDTVLRHWNRTASEYPRELGVPELFDAQVDRDPAGVAVAGAGQVLTYAQLQARSRELVHILLDEGIEPGGRVGICLSRSTDLVASVLAVMRAGAAYVPLDPALPAERLAFMARDAGLDLILTEMSLAERCPETAPLLFIGQASADPVQERGGGDRPARATDPQALAYLLYTSGSTGQPKGVEIRHRNLVNFLVSMAAEPGLRRGDKLLAVTTLSFDISGLELLLPLIVGARIELASTEEAADGRLLAQRMLDSQPTHMQATPATWRMLLESGWAGSPDLTVLCGGEALPRDLADRLLDCCRVVWNLYGPTETTIWSTLDRVAASPAAISIGAPIANTQVYVLDRARQPVPVGAVGELWIGGDGVACGYHNRPELTAEKFVPDPFSDSPGARLYRTGDLARWRSDGRLVHLGRIDFQVKIRGFRVELAEIEAALNDHPGVRQAAVTAHESEQGFRQLVGYVVPAADAPSTVDLRSFLESRLPAYMVPAQIVFLEALPLTANNKVDIRALPPPAAAPASDADRLPRSLLETQLLALWQQALDNYRLGIHDDFFDAGGHSIMAVSLVANIESALGRRLPLATLFEAPTVARMASVLQKEDWTESWRSLVAIQPRGTRTPVFAVPGVGGNVLVFAPLARLLGNDRAFFGLQARGLDGREEPFDDVREAARYYVSEIRTARPHGPYIIAGACTGGVIAYEIAQQLLASGERVFLGILESWHPSSYAEYRRVIPSFGKLVFIWRRGCDYLREILRLPLRAWPGFIREKIANARRSLTAPPGMLDGGFGEIQELRVMQSTLRAVAGYTVRPYPGSLLNIVASQRRVAPGALDTRRSWEGLASGGASAHHIPASDSGQLFVSPHVEEMAGYLQAYVDGDAG